MKGNSIFEKHTVFVNFFRIFLISLLDILPASWCRKIFLFCSNGKETRAKTCVSAAKSYKALEAIYTFEKKKARGMDYFWGTILSNSCAIRNRLLLTKQQIKQAIEEVAAEKAKVSVLSLASGSSRAIIEVLAELEKNIRDKTFVKFVDISREALDYSRNLVKLYKIDCDGRLEWQQGSIGSRIWDSSNYDIVEMVGILDYFDDERALKLLKLVYDNLAVGGRLVTCNIMPNIEKPFVTKGLDWPMIYRSPDHLKKIVKQVGFDVEIIVEPLQVHALCVAFRPRG
ncbi:MAG TPA: class I SAM-dependent methyltransferase [Candidatus Ratteibacteria bacterium]|nr:class I SAM-dependent methyltransferase [Candidatus Ratteibacteria bacterium]